MSEWYNDGELIYKEPLIRGFDSLLAAFIGLFSSENISKQMVKVADIKEF